MSHFYCFFIDKKYFVLDDDLQQLLMAYDEVKELASTLIPEVSILAVSDNSLQQLLSRMDLQKKTHREGSANVLCNDRDLFIAKILFHFARFGINDSCRVQSFFDLFAEKISLMSFSYLHENKDLCQKYNDSSVVFVYKDKKANCCSELFNKYLEQNEHRPKTAKSGDALVLHNGKYCFDNEKPITKIVFAFDNAITGASTIKALKFYLGIDNAPDRLDETRCFFYDYNNSQKIQIKTIININSPEIELVVCFYSEKAYLAINEFVENQKSNGININFIRGEKLPKTEKDVRDKIGNLYKSSYLVDGFETLDFYPVIREINQPKKNWLKDKYMKNDKCYSVFILQPENELQVR